MEIISFDPVRGNFEKSYNELMQVLISNIENKDELLLLYSDSINRCNNSISNYLKLATVREKAYFNIGRFSALCNLIKNLEDYDKVLQNYLQPYLNLNIDDIVYIKYNNIIYKTTIIKKEGNKIQTKYGKRWFTQDDYLDYIFPYQEKNNLHKSGKLKDCYDCDKCKGFRQGKCAYGYKVSTYYGFTYRFDGTRFKVLKGTPRELCCKNMKD